MAQPRILVVEDDAAIRRGVVDALRFEGFAVQEAGDGRAGLSLATTADCHLVLLDLILPHVDGLDILRQVRAVRPTLPVIILTARGEESDRVAGLRLGADDYVVKPFSVRELTARVRAVLRRSPERPTDVTHVDFPGGRIDLLRREVCFTGGGRDDLTEREGELLRYLACHVGRAISRQEIIAHVWRMDPAGGETRTIDMHIARLREKLRDNPAAPAVILTVRGQGYMLARPEAAP